MHLIIIFQIRINIIMPEQQINTIQFWISWFEVANGNHKRGIKFQYIPAHCLVMNFKRLKLHMTLRNRALPDYLYENRVSLCSLWLLMIFFCRHVSTSWAENSLLHCRLQPHGFRRSCSMRRTLRASRRLFDRLYLNPANHSATIII